MLFNNILSSLVVVACISASNARPVAQSDNNDWNFDNLRRPSGALSASTRLYDGHPRTSSPPEAANNSQAIVPVDIEVVGAAESNSRIAPFRVELGGNVGRDSYDDLEERPNPAAYLFRGHAAIPADFAAGAGATTSIDAPVSSATPVVAGDNGRAAPLWVGLGGNVGGRVLSNGPVELEGDDTSSGLRAGAM
ncbi:hypothetical protein NMY22_g2405 [Coprinellus aureogranulatus]|nr:hypothetical protein NMY22_g2405 [Coprinellus aureogranulatus]